MIDELIIIDKAGIALFYHNFLHKDYIDDNFHLIASFLDQISRFTKVALKDYLNMIEWQKYVFFFYVHKKTQYLLIFKCDNTKIGDKALIKKSLDMIAKTIFDRFLIIFEKELLNFNGEISRFRSFSEELNKMFKAK